MLSKLEWHEIVGGLVVSAVLFFGGQWLANSQASKQAAPEILETITIRLSEVERELKETRGMLRIAESRIMSLTLANAELTNALGGNLQEVQMQGMFSYIDSLKRPAWCKQIEHSPPEKPVFRMKYLNVEYEIAYGVSVAKYIGGTDFDNHPQEIAEAYYENDMRSYRSKDYREFIEPISSDENPKVYRRQFAKFYVNMPSGVEMICGLQINGLEED